ncbi:MAG: response regulator transcription factor [Balneolia bacterium]|nr:response regulator transcription factor [Balneolia bacterium]
MKVLIIEDDEIIGNLVKQILQRKEYEPVLVDSGAEGEEKALNESYDCIILDLGLPDKDGLEICKNIRSAGIDTPLLILSAYDTVDTKVNGLSLGADDYLTKPFDSKELVARLQALLRRHEQGKTKDTFSCGELEINLLERKFTVNGNEVYLTNNEFDLMAYFLKNQNRTLTLNELAENVWDISFDTKTNYINVYLSYIRKKIKPYTKKKYFVTMRKQGFKIVNE